MKKMGFLFVVLLTIFMCSCADGSSEEKLRLYEEASNQWEDFFKSDQFSMVVDVTVSVKERENASPLIEKTRGKAKICKSPFYLEAMENGDFILIQEEQGKLYSYTRPSILGEGSYLERSYFGEINSVDDVEDSYYNEDPLSGLKVESMKISFEEDVYSFKINMYDYLQNTDDESVKKVIESLDIDEDIFKKFWVTLSMSFSETTANLGIQMECEYKGMCISISMDTKFDNQTFKKIDLQNNPNYIVKQPNTIENVYQFSSIGKTILIPSYLVNSVNYFKFNLEKGQYGIYVTDELGTEAGNWIDDWALGSLYIRLYDENKKEIPMGMDLYATGFTQKTFYISKPGIYYLGVTSDISCDMAMCIQKLNYDTIGFESTHDGTSYKGKIEGEYDFDEFTIDGKENELFVLKNIGESPIPLIYMSYEDSKEKYTNNAEFVIINDRKMIKLKEGENKFIICSDFHNYTEPFEYEFTSKKYILKNGYEDKYEDLKQVTTDYSDLSYLAGYYLPNPRLSFDVDTKSIIDFEFKTQGTDSSYVYAIVKDLEGNIYYSMDRRGRSIFELAPGKYIVEINSDYEFDECQIKYTATKIEDKEIDVTLEKSSLSEFLSDNFPFVKAQNVGRTQTVKCNFAINEDTLILFDPSIKVYHKDGTPVINLDATFYQIVYLEQGEYYYLIKDSGSYYSTPSSLMLGIVNDKLETCSSPNQMKEIEIGQELVFKKEWERDQEYLILNIQEDGIYHFNQWITIYDENFRYITTVNDFTKLKAGTYYIVYSYNFSTEVIQEVSIVITKE